MGFHWIQWFAMWRMNAVAINAVAVHLVTKMYPKWIEVYTKSTRPLGVFQP